MGVPRLGGPGVEEGVGVTGEEVLSNASSHRALKDRPTREGTAEVHCTYRVHTEQNTYEIFK